MAPARRSTGRHAKTLDSPQFSTGSLSSRPISSRAALLGQSRAVRTFQRKASNMIEIPDSDDMLDTISVNSSTTSRNARLKEVAIPPYRPSDRRMSSRNAGSASDPPSSVIDSFDDEGSGYETPATSAAVTPAESISHGSSAKTSKSSRVNATARALELQQSQYALGRPPSNRKRLAATMAANDYSDNDESPDVKLARKLQAEEYEAVDNLHSSTKRRKTSRATSSIQVIGSSESSLDDLSDPPAFDSDSEEEFPIAAKRRVSSNRGRTQRGRPPARHSVKSITPKVPVVVDSGDDSELTSLSDVVSIHDTEESEFEANSDLEEMVTEPSAVQSAASEDDEQTRTVSIRRNVRNRNRPRRSRPRPSGLSGKQRERLKLEKAHPSIKTMWKDLEQVEIIKPIAGDQPAEISRKLKSFQLEGVNWMIRQEQTEYKGGLLGDEMGMGKTIQAVSLIMSDFPAKDPTLVVVPPVALMQWQSEINSYTDGKLKVLVYHGSKVKSLSIKELRKYNVIMVSYSGLESVHRKENKGWNRDGGLVKEDSALHAIKYHRIMLDEAHSIKSRTTGVAKACFALKSDFKWALSGTPVQNRIGEFFSLLRFLQIEPFACYFCKKCPCKQLHWAQDSNHACVHCKHTGFQHVSVFNQEILNPITQGEDMSERREGLRKLRLITDRIMLRRMKRDHTSSMELPPKEVIIHNEFFGEEERDFSSGIMTNTARKFDTYVSQGVMLNNYANIFGLIMQMRQTANHPDLILRKHADGGQNILVCCICDEPAEEAIRSRCHHEFCRQCVKDYVRSFEGLEGSRSEAEHPDCPRCHIPLTIDFDQPDIEQDEDNVRRGSIINRIKMEDWTSSTKIEMLVYDLYRLRSKKQTQKSIVFSQFTSMLQLVEWRLRRAGFNTVMLDGSMTPDQRQRSIDYFMNNVNVEVFLVSLKAGGVALNLTEASRVFIVDPWWNPAAEWQSADRCHRIGQRRPCVITRLCIEDSVESRIVLLQEKKANMINGTINNDQVAIDKLSPEDMQFLFRGS